MTRGQRKRRRADIENRNEMLGGAITSVALLIDIPEFENIRRSLLLFIPLGPETLSRGRGSPGDSATFVPQGYS